MFKFFSILFVLVVGFQASADDFKYFRKSIFSAPIHGRTQGLGKKGYIRCERITEEGKAGVRIIRLGRDGVQRSGDNYASRAEPSKIFVESKFKKSMGETASEDKKFLDMDFIRNKYLKARDICDDHRALVDAAGALIRHKESNDNEEQEQEEQEQPSVPANPPAPPAVPEND